MSNLSVFKSDNEIEIIIDQQTGESFCSVSGYARMSGKDKGTISRRLKGVAQDVAKIDELVTSGGLQGIALFSVDTALNFLVKDKPALVGSLIDVVERLTGNRPAFPIFQKEGRNKKSDPEKRVQKRLAKKLNGVIEVACKAGAIDILTSTEVIEVKKAKQWKAAIGQALVYQLEYPEKQARIHLYEECSTEFKQMVISFASRLGVIATFESEELYKVRDVECLRAARQN
jgi:hypothetical protein